MKRGFLLILMLLCFLSSERGRADQVLSTAKKSQKLNVPLNNNDLFPDGRFYDCKLNMFPGGWKIAHGVNHHYPNDARIKKDEDGKKYLSVKLGKGSNIMLVKHIPLNPKWKKLRLRVKARVPQLTPGQVKWKNPSIVTYFYDGNGKRINKYPATVIFTKKVPEFTVETRYFNVDKNAKELAIYAGLYGGRGIIEIEFIELTEVESNSALVSELDGGVSSKSSKSKAKYVALEELAPQHSIISETRSELILNGIWKFRPDKGKHVKTKYGFIRVPGLWSSSHPWDKVNLDGVKFVPQNGGWCKKELATNLNAWYEKELVIPHDWVNRAIHLEMDRVCGIADVYIDNQIAGNIQWPYGNLDITSLVTPGKKINLKLLVRTSSRVEFFKDFNFYTSVKKKAKIYNMGIAGDVVLKGIPKEVYVESAFIQTSVRNHQMKITVEMNNETFSGDAKFKFIIRELNGDIVKEQVFHIELDARKKSAKTFIIPWKNPKLWSYRQPNLYLLNIEMNAGGHYDVYSERFGFREFRIVGRNMLLNEKPFRFRPLFIGTHPVGGMPEVIRKMMHDYLNAGFNLLEIKPTDTFLTGKLCFDKEWATCADEMGIPIIIPMTSFNSVIANTANMKDEELSVWEREFIANWKRIRNHPSLLVLMVGFNNFGNHGGASPMRIGNAKRQQYPAKAYHKKIATGKQIMDIMRKYDSTRPVASHHSGPVGDILTQDLYLNFLPLQEREAWLSEWAKTGDRPYMAVEFGCPYDMTMMRGREIGPGGVFTTEPMLTEICSIYLGEHAYVNESKAYRHRVAKKWKSKRRYSNWHSEKAIRHNPVYHELLSLFIRNTFRSWRAMGITGGLCPWRDGSGWGAREISSSQRNPVSSKRTGGRGAIVESISKMSDEAYSPKHINVAGKSLIAVNSDTLAYIAGDTSDFTNKHHHFVSGGKVEKQLAVLNDCSHKGGAIFQYQVFVGGKVYSKGKLTKTVPAGSTVFLPFHFTLPKVKTVTDGKIVMNGTILGVHHFDEFPFRIYPEIQSGKSVYLYDASGITEKYLTRLGFIVHLVNKIPDSKVYSLVIGEKTFSSPGFPYSELQQFVEGGGRVMIMGETPDFYRKFFGFRVGRHLARRAFVIPTMKYTSAVNNIKSEDLRDWNGKSLFVAETEGTNLNDDSNGTTTPRYGYHWGNVGAVSSSPIEKPHASGWTPLLEMEYGLAYSPLMQLFLGKGMILLTTLDFAHRNLPDPAADRLFVQTLDYLTQVDVVLRRQVSTICDSKELMFLKKLQLKFRELTDIPESGILIIGAKTNYSSSKLNQFLSRGGSVVFLPRGAGKKIPGFSIISRTVGKITKLPNWNVARGLSISDLYLKTDYIGPILVPNDNSSEIAAHGLLGRRVVGKGEILAIQLVPEMLNATKYDYRKFPSWRWTRTFSQLLTNLGGTFVSDLKFFTRQSESVVPKIFRIPEKWRAKFEWQVPASGNIIADRGNNGLKHGWHKPEFDDSKWRPINTGESFQDQGDFFENRNGVLWYRVRFTIPTELKKKPLLLDLGLIDDMDISYLNGHPIGKTNSYHIKRKYRIAPWAVKFGQENVIAVRVFDHKGNGGILGKPTIKEIVPIKIRESYHLYVNNYCDGEDGDDVFRYRCW